jgi:hypothetical protein
LVVPYSTLGSIDSGQYVFKFIEINLANFSPGQMASAGL